MAAHPQAVDTWMLRMSFGHSALCTPLGGNTAAQTAATKAGYAAEGCFIGERK